MKALAGLAVAASLLACASAAQAAQVLLDFDGIDTANATLRLNPIREFYNGGKARFGDTVGPDFGVSFTSEVVALREFGAPCADGNTLINESPSGPNILGFNLPGPSFMNVASGFTGMISMAYVAQLPATIRVWSGVNGTGEVLATLDLAQQTGGPCAPRVILCHWQQASAAFAGTARSLDFGNAVRIAAFDDIALDVNPPSSVPEPATWALSILGLGLTGATLRRRRRSVAFA